MFVLRFLPCLNFQASYEYVKYLRMLVTRKINISNIVKSRIKIQIVFYISWFTLILKLTTKYLIKFVIFYVKWKQHIIKQMRVWALSIPRITSDMKIEKTWSPIIAKLLFKTYNISVLIQLRRSMVIIR